MLPTEVDERAIAELISRSTGIPVANLLSDERSKLLDMEVDLKSWVINQDEAIEAACGAILRARTGISDPNRPNGTFMFLGPTGVGKTELAKSLAKFLFNSESALLRYDMSEYMEKHSVSRLIGAAPGYIGYEEGGQLTEAVRKKPYSVILFDEIEKAHLEVLNVLLQVLDDGRLTDGKGRTIDFRNTVIIMTSNVGSEYLTDEEDNAKEKVLNKVNQVFSPEFLNRIDEIIVFNSLNREAIAQIVKLRLEELAQRLAKQEIELNYVPKGSQEVINYIAARGYNHAFGARPIKRLIQNEIETPIAKKILTNRGKLKHKVMLSVDRDKGEMHIAMKN